MLDKPNIVFILADQLRSQSLPLFGERQISTPNIDRVAREGVKFTNAVSTCPLCTPYRSMLLTGRHPFETGHIINNVRTRHDEISIADVFNNAGYTTGWIGKWHLFSGPTPEFVEFEYIPDGRDRLGFSYFRAYNYHTQFFDGSVCLDEGKHEQWEGYETEGLLRYFDEFLGISDPPFCLFVSPHMPHHGGGIPGGGSTQDASPNGRLAPQRFYEAIPEELSLPRNVPDHMTESTCECYRDYLAMILAVDEMVGRVMRKLRDTSLLENTILFFGSDHGSLMGSHGPSIDQVSGNDDLAYTWQPWEKRTPWEESISVPLILRMPDESLAGSQSEALIAPTDIFPTMCGLCDIDIPQTVSGRDLSDTWMGRDDHAEREALFCCYINDAHLSPGSEWRGVRTKNWNYFRFLNGDTGLYYLSDDPSMMHNLVDVGDYTSTRSEMESMLLSFMDRWKDDFMPAPEYHSWFDNRHVVRNTFGALGDPLNEPDWSLL